MRILILSYFMLIFSLNLQAINTEHYSPKENYIFSLKDIQETVRAGVEKADQRISALVQTQDINKVAQYYFNDYLAGIASYNDRAPQTVDLVESYKTDLVNAYVLKEFKERFPQYIYDRSAWMFNSVGGVYASTIILHCSLKEYIVLWGTTLRADNKFSGYYPFMNEFDVMTRGRMESHDVNAWGHASVVYKPIVQDSVISDTVDTSNLIPKSVRSYNLDAHTYMISYAQAGREMWKAFIPGTLMPGVFVNQDWDGIKSHLVESFRAFWYMNDDSAEISFMENPNYRAIWIIDEYMKINE